MISQPLKPYVIGLDLGGTNSVFGVVDSRGDIKATTAIKTQAYSTVEDYVDASIEALQTELRRFTSIPSSNERASIPERDERENVVCTTAS